ncbi:MAG: photosystem I assembly protein Ycf3 [Parcubacteria group bacterium ADurb.Bin159]|nr:MAG: photosystem I assembly protein Ycf3 [Parcubacteria group bacterium ADurb.Bin159]
MLKNLHKIIIILSLAIIFIFIISECAIKVYLADFYFREALVSRMEEDWPKTLQNYDKVLKILPRQHYYRSRFAEDLRKGLTFYPNPSSKIKILEIGIATIENVPLEERILAMMTNQANMLAEKIHLSGEKDYSQAEELFEKISALSPKMAGIYNDWCQLKIYEENWEEALEVCEKALSLYPPADYPGIINDHYQMIIAEEINVYDKLGQIYQKQGEYDKALESWFKLLHLSPFEYHIHKKIANIYYLRGDIDKAIFENLHGFTLNPKDSTWPFAIALLYKEKGDIDKAIYYATIALNLSPEDEEIKNFLSEIKLE